MAAAPEFSTVPDLSMPASMGDLSATSNMEDVLEQLDMTTATMNMQERQRHQHLCLLQVSIATLA